MCQRRALVLTNVAHSTHLILESFLSGIAELHRLFIIARSKRFGNAFCELLYETAVESAGGLHSFSEDWNWFSTFLPIKARKDTLILFLAG